MFVHERSRSVNVGASSCALFSSPSQVKFLSVSECLFRSTYAESSEQRLATSCLNDIPIPLTLYFCIVQSLIHLLARAHLLWLMAGKVFCALRSWCRFLAFFFFVKYSDLKINIKGGMKLYYATHIILCTTLMETSGDSVATYPTEENGPI